MPSLLWLFACAYLIIAVGTLLEADFRPARDAAPGPLAYGIVALLFAVAWPVRMLRAIWRTPEED